MITHILVLSEEDSHTADNDCVCSPILIHADEVDDTLIYLHRELNKCQ